MKKSRQKPIFWQLFPSLIAVAILFVAVMVIYVCTTFRDFYYIQTEQDLKGRAGLVIEEFLPHLQEKNLDRLQALSLNKGKISNTRFTVILPDGNVAGDTRESPENMENHFDRPEFQEALRGKIGRAKRYSETLAEDYIYVAVPIIRGSEVLGVVRASISLTSIQKTLWQIYRQMIVGGLAILILLSALSWRLSKRISKPIESIKEYAQNLVQSEFTDRLNIQEQYPLEIQELGSAMNTLSYQLSQRIKTILRQKNDQKAVLESMTEGLLAIDMQRDIIDVNPTAQEMFGLSESNVGDNFSELVNEPTLHQIVDQCLMRRTTVEEDIQIKKETENITLAVKGTTLRSRKGKIIGVLMVFNDVTRLRMLESHRTEFASNVSHELKTPLTTIRGFSEILLETKDLNVPEIRNFVKIINRHALRVTSIVNDLLSLSKLESARGVEEMEFLEQSLLPIIENAKENCIMRAKSKEIEILVSVKKDQKGTVNAPLLEQAFVNLIDNAVKYSPDKSTVRVTTETTNNFIQVKVSDNGPGIEPEHLERLFERFYRVDKGRSRAVGGTGLGLSIVKHIALVHEGRVSVKSQIGKGSEFIFEIPRPDQNVQLDLI